MKGDKYKMCECPHHALGAWLVLIVGVLFLLRDLNVWDFWNITGWTALFVLVGLKLVSKRMCKCC